LASIPLADVLTNGRPTLAEFGWKTCIPCKKMKPILEELALEYGAELDVVIVEVYEHSDLTEQYGITLIPTQIIFDGTGVEATRHIGFWPKEEIIAQLENMGLL
jgi:thioredoxin 1